MSAFYVYAFLRDDLTPYYIGKGSGTRAFVSVGRTIPAPQNPSAIIFLASNLSEEEAFTLERIWIRCLGRATNGTGILRNLTEGGEGTSGYRHSKETRALISSKNSNPSQDKIAKMVAANKGRLKSEAQRGAMRRANIGKKLSDEQKQKMRLAHLGKKHTQEAKDKMKGPRKPRIQEVCDAT